MEKKTSYAEFSSQLNDKNIVVLEIGRALTRCGFAGEPAPRAIIESSVNDEKGNKLFLHRISDKDQLRTHLGKYIERIYFNQLAVSPKEKKVVVVESVFCNSSFRQVLTNVLFEQFSVPSLLFVPDHLMALTTLGRSTGLIVDIGSEEAISIAVVNGVTLLDGTQFASLGARTLDSLIQNQLVNYNPSMAGKLEQHVIEDIRVRTCFVSPYKRALQLTESKIKIAERMEKTRDSSQPNPQQGYYIMADEDAASPASIVYSLSGHKSVRVPGSLREGACEILFETFGYEHSLVTMLIETVLQAPIDCRRELAENILVVGGLANLPGLEHRLSEEVRNFVGNGRFSSNIMQSFKFHQCICPRNYVSWLGASIFCNPTSVELRSTSRDQWLKDGRQSFREWSDLIR